MVEKKMFIYFYRNGKTSKEELVVKFDENAGKNYNIQLTHHQIDTFKDDYNNGDFRRYIGALIPIKTENALICTSRLGMTFIMWSFEDKIDDFKKKVYEYFEKEVQCRQNEIEKMKREMNIIFN